MNTISSLFNWIGNTIGANPSTLTTTSKTLVGAINEVDSGWLNKVYPVGSVYVSVNSTSPATLFGGTWTQIKGRFLLGVGTPDDNTNAYWGTNLTYDGTNKYDENAKSKGGESLHTLQDYEMPAHSHSVGAAYPFTAGGAQPLVPYASNATEYGSYSGVVKSAGGGLAHNNMPPYYAVYMWERTA